MSLRKVLDYWWTGPILGVVLAGYFGYRMQGSDKQIFLPGKTSSGHHQIEVACEKCHTPFGGVKQKACLDCHGAGLDTELDSHAASVFNDPRSYTMLEIVDATRCVSCHSEHIADMAGGNTLNVPDDFCFPCHKDIAKERPSHVGFKEDGCATSGCHNYHDNRALYEDFIAKHLDERPTNSKAVVIRRSFPAHGDQSKKLVKEEQDSQGHAGNTGIVGEWAASRHAEAGVNCSKCHQPSDPVLGVNAEWSDHVAITTCRRCHAYETKGFFAGKHGMRAAVGLTPMRPEQARLPMKSKAHNKQLTCNSCHRAHRYDTRVAAAESCLGCHDDIHSKAYSAAPHHQLWLKELEGLASDGSGVSCATCHLPRSIVKEDGKERVAVDHNQNANLRPSSKMIRGVCLQCHGLEFTLQALADPDLSLNNYSGAPKKQIDTLDMVRIRLRDKKAGQ